MAYAVFFIHIEIHRLYITLILFKLIRKQYILHKRTKLFFNKFNLNENLFLNILQY